MALQRRTELHVHMGGRLTWRDLLELGASCYEQIDWSPYQGDEDPSQLFRHALTGDANAIARFRQACVMSDADGGDFSRFILHFSFGICVMRHYARVLGQHRDLVLHLTRTDKTQGMRYVEYRAMLGLDVSDPDGFLRFHTLNAESLRDASDERTTFRYLISLPRTMPMDSYSLVRRLLSERPDLVPTIVGLDFCHVEEGHPPKHIRPLMAQLERDNAADPATSLGVVYHVGESFFDKSLESAVRWCHEAATMGARRLGHCIALGLDPAVALARREGAHETDLVNERIDQIAWDLQHAAKLREYGVFVDENELRREGQALLETSPEAYVQRPYMTQRIEDIRRRQTFVLDELARLNVVIETCPTSNLRIGGVPDPASHPIHRFLKSNVPLAVGADDPGVFDVTLADELDWITRHTDWTAKRLAKRLGDPRRFALARGV
ncbi:MAG: hypothetical protein IT440_11465 [Phycisphaeraceae bacterium]|nr:hypothetical protein [Phycisphaeraceae bacterium]